MHAKLRDFFDLRLEHVLASLPERITRLFDEVPLHVEDFPSPEIMRQLNVSDRGSLCGLYTGVPLTNRSVDHPSRMPDVVTIYREGILRAAENELGALTEPELIRQIRITILHELAHYHGLEEAEITDLGYE
ncbi:MAG: metallopeptidase family protein [Pirellulales bacterium]|nr:metallopeptidase family protein [Pirellulales bacterium]